MRCYENVVVIIDKMQLLFNSLIHYDERTYSDLYAREKSTGITIICFDGNKVHTS